MKHKHAFLMLAFALLSSHCAASCADDPKKQETASEPGVQRPLLRHPRSHIPHMHDGGLNAPNPSESAQADQ